MISALVVAPLIFAGPSEAKPPRAPHRYTARIEPLAGYVGQSTCSPWAKPGTTAFANLLLRSYPRSRSLGIVRACNVGGKSEHKEGRAFDWGVSAHDARDRRNVQVLMKWLLQRDRFGNRYAMARRLGIQYMIWNRRIWGAYSAGSGWRRYTGANPHTDHVHFSLSWAGARKQSSFWRPRNFKASAPAPRPPKPPVPNPDPRPRPRPRPQTAPKPASRSIAEPQSPRTLQTGPVLYDERVALSATARGGVRTKGALRRGHRYLIEVSGKYRYASGARFADAECTSARTSDWWRDRSVRRDDRYADHLDVYIDGHDLYSVADDGADCDAGSHVYRWIYKAPRTGRVPLRIWDPTSHADNSGRLNVRVTDLRVRNRMSWSVPASAPAGATSPGSLRAGVDYLVTVTGTWRDGTGVTADAECSRTTTDSTWRRDRSGVSWDPSADHFDMLLSDFNEDDLATDNEDVNGDPAVDAGDRCDATGHRYSFVWHAHQTEPLNLRVQDPGEYAGNVGRLQVSVEPYVAPVEPQPEPEPEPEPIPAETVRVDSASAGPVVTTRHYPRGTRLRLTAKGWYLMREATDWIAADAECTATSADRTWRSTRLDGLFNGRSQPLGDIAVNGRIDNWWPKDGSGTCDEQNHEYTFDLTTDRDGPVSLVIADDNYGDNRGVVTVTVAAR